MLRFMQGVRFCTVAQVGGVVKKRNMALLCGQLQSVNKNLALAEIEQIYIYHLILDDTMVDLCIDLFFDVQ